MTPFATLEDYEARYGKPEDAERVETLLADASAFIASQPGFAVREGDDLQAAALTAVTCALVNRKMLAEMAVNDKAAFTQLVELSKSKRV